MRGWSVPLRRHSRCLRRVEAIAPSLRSPTERSRTSIAADLPNSMIEDGTAAGDVLVTGRITDNLVACLLQLDPADDEALLWFAPGELDALVTQ